MAKYYHKATTEIRDERRAQARKTCVGYFAHAFFVTQPFFIHTKIDHAVCRFGVMPFVVIVER